MGHYTSAKAAQDAFAVRVLSGMRRRAMTLRGFCRAVALDPSFISKVLSGKRSPPSEEAVLRRIAGVLNLDAVELIVSAGRIPAEWRALWKDERLFRDIHVLATGGVPYQGVGRAERAPKGGRAPLGVPYQGAPLRGVQRAERAPKGGRAPLGVPLGQLPEELL